MVQYSTDMSPSERFFFDAMDYKYELRRIISHFKGIAALTALYNNTNNVEEVKTAIACTNLNQRAKQVKSLTTHMTQTLILSTYMNENRCG